MVPACFSGERAVHVDVQRNTDPLYARYGAMMAKHIPAHRFWVRAGTAKPWLCRVQTARVSRTPIKAVFQPKNLPPDKIPGKGDYRARRGNGTRAPAALAGMEYFGFPQSGTTGAAGCTGR